MPYVMMLVHVTGGRGDGTQWPDAGDLLLCDEYEARDLITGGLAVAHSHVEPRTEPAAGEETPAAAPDGTGAPGIRSPKEAWVMHAVSLGVTPELAAAMTKAQLVEQFK